MHDSKFHCIFIVAFMMLPAYRPNLTLILSLAADHARERDKAKGVPNSEA